MSSDNESKLDRRPSSVAEVHEILTRKILFGTLAPNQRITIEATARELGVSATPVREALLRLEGDNLVVSDPGRGYSTTPLVDAAGLRALYEFRLLVEPWAARVAAVDRLGNPGVRLLASLERLQESFNTGQDRRALLLAHDALFHQEIIQASGNPVLAHAFSQTHCHLHIYRLQPEAVDSEDTLVEHSALALAIRDSDAVAAEAAMRSHIEQSFERYESRI
jgi:DNA-binding GntR family transcriptional regulator